MFFTDSTPATPPPSTCSHGHRSSFILQTVEGGSICLLCLSNVVSNSNSPTLHVSYALSQLSRALSQPQFLQSLLTFHSHFLISPLVQALSSFDDEPISKQITDLIVKMCEFGGCEVFGEFVAKVAEKASSGTLGWSRRQVYMLHCFGLLLDYQKNNPYAHIKDKEALVFNLVTGLHLPSEEIRGEILFVLYKISILEYAHKDGDCNGADVLFNHCPKLLRLSLETLMKTQSDDVRLNCVALLTVLAQRGFFGTACANDVSNKASLGVDNFLQTTDEMTNEPNLSILFVEAIKGPLLSSDSEVQIGTLDLVLFYLSSEGSSQKEIQVLVEENIADYVFEILRLSGCKDPTVNSCIQVLDLLSMAEQAFKQRLAIGFTTLVPVLRYVTEIPFHPAQTRTLKLIWNCVLNCPGIASGTQIEELGQMLAKMLSKHIDGEIGMLSETFDMACSTLVALMKSPSSYGTSNFATSVCDASKHAVLTCLRFYDKDPLQLLHSLYLLKEAYAYSYSNMELRIYILDVCKTHLLPWLMEAINEMEEDIALGVLETFHSILLQDSDTQIKEFTYLLASSSWFSFSFGCLGLFPSDRMKCRVYLMFSSIVDVLLGSNSGEPIRDAALHLPSDPMDLLFLLGQKNSHNLELFSCQNAVLLILYASSLYDDRLADEKMMLASLEQYILCNSNDLLHGASDSVSTEQLISLYGLYRGSPKMSHQIPFSPEAERIMLQLMTQKEWDFLSTKIHSTSLKWLFQQEKISNSLSNQILKFCRCNSLNNDTHVTVHGYISQNIDVHAIAELVSSGDNLGAIVFVCLLRELAKEGGEDDIIAVVNILLAIIDIYPDSSDQLNLRGIGGAIQNLYHRTCSSSPRIFVAISQLIFSILCSAQPESLSDDEAWLAVTMKLMDYLIQTVAQDGWTQEACMVIAILTLVLHHSTNKAMVEASKTIFLSNPFFSTISTAVSAYCSKGHALADHDEGTKTGETLIFLLLLLYFSLTSVHVVLPGILNWQDLLDTGSGSNSLSFLSIRCRELCRLIHFGSPLIKLVASHCLLEMLSQKSDKLISNTGHLLSVLAVLEGQVFCSDIRVALNCARCLSIIMEGGVSGKSGWCRLIIEELAMSLAAPCLVSKSFMVHHKPAVHIAVALLKQQAIPEWMSSVFDDSCISGIIQNLTVSNLSSEIVILFRELLHSGFLKAEQTSGLNRVFQACRKCIYAEDSHNMSSTEDNPEKVVIAHKNLPEVRNFLINLVSSPGTDPTESRSSNKKLLEEIELFCKSMMEQDDS